MIYDFNIYNGNNYLNRKFLLLTIYMIIGSENMKKKKMKALLFPEPWKVELIEIDIPKPGPNQVLAEMRSVGVCGSDVGIFEGNHWIEAHEPGGYGHETGAIAVEVGENVEGISEGDHLARMAQDYAEYSTYVNVIGHGKDEEKGAMPIVRNDLTLSIRIDKYGHLSYTVDRGNGSK
ncbi:MAG: alcohol dehydrogenase catalytic domain-containing protein [Candidatus Lokiarchaeota archaeon]|nr:alcohol dehydrogenase catalytic domain-containing protein [Candidatus Lokiarchaeota archaeon]